MQQKHMTILKQMS